MTAVTKETEVTEHHRYISPVPKGGYMVRVTRQSGTRYAPTLEEAIAKRSELFREIFGEEYSEDAAKRTPYSTNRASSVRGVQLVKLKNGKEFWQVKFRNPVTGRVQIRKFFISRWGHEEGYRQAVAVKEQQELTTSNPDGDERTP